MCITCPASQCPVTQSLANVSDLEEDPFVKPIIAALSSAGADSCCEVELSPEVRNQVAAPGWVWVRLDCTATRRFARARWQPGTLGLPNMYRRLLVGMVLFLSGHVPG